MPLGQRLIGARLFMLLRSTRESGNHLYDREVGYKEIHRQLILMIGRPGGLSSQEIVALTGHEKAQVSRAIKPLEQEGLIERTRLRANLTLLPPGKRVFDRIVAIGRARDTELTAQIDPADHKRFIAITEALTEQSAGIYAEERRLNVEAGVIQGLAPTGQGLPPWPRGADNQQTNSLVADMIIPKLISLVAYMRRAGMLAYQRSHGLSYFQWNVLALIGEYPPMPLARLILGMGRDKSQVGRTVAYLEGEGLIMRTRPTRRRDIMLEPTEKGAAFFTTMYELATSREETLWDGHDAADRDFYFRTVEALTANARAMLAQEVAAGQAA